MKPDPLLTNLLSSSFLPPQSHNSSSKHLLDLDKYHEIELGKIFDALHSLQNLRVQVGSFFGTATVAIISIGFNSHIAGIFFSGASFLWIFIILEMQFRRSIFIHYCRGLRLKALYAPEDDDFYIIAFINPSLREIIQGLAQQRDFKVRRDELIRIAGQPYGIISFWVPWTVSLAQVLLGWILWYSFGWRLF